MPKNLEISILLDFYGQLLTEKQRDVVDYYYNEDFSLGEIADQLGISRQGVRDAVKRAENILIDFEEKLGFVKYFEKIQKNLILIKQSADNIRLMNKNSSFNMNIDKELNNIINITNKLIID